MWTVRQTDSSTLLAKSLHCVELEVTMVCGYIVARWCYGTWQRKATVGDC